MYCVALDSGHGKNTPGKRSPDGTLMEYEFNHDVTDRIKRHLKRHGVEVVLTSPDELIDVSLTNRAKIANESKADIFVSIHANAYSNTWTSASGWEIYCYKKSIAAEKLAESIMNESIPFLGLKNRGIKTANFTVLIKSNMSAVLIEHGFYTNKEECEKLKNNEFREKCAIADSRGILNYLGIKWKEENVTYSDTDCIVDELVEIGIVTDPEGMKAEIKKEPNGRLYWLAKKMLEYIK